MEVIKDILKSFIAFMLATLMTTGHIQQMIDFASPLNEMAFFVILLLIGSFYAVSFTLNLLEKK